MKIYNSKAQRAVHIISIMVFFIIFLGRMNIDQAHAVARYDFTGQFIKGAIVSIVLWVSSTTVCTKLTNKYFE